jgi:transposase
MDNKDWVSDVRTLRVKELMAKHGWSMASCVEMRRQLGVGKQQILKSKAFREAVKSRTTAEVAAMFGLGLSVVSKYRIRFGVAKKRTASLIYDRAFMKAVRSGRQASDIAKSFGCSDAYVRMLRKAEGK